jgi:hypothetical protein
MIRETLETVMAQGDPAFDRSIPDDRTAPRHRMQLSLTQLLAGVLAAVTAAVGASYLGVNGTVIGAAVMSLVSAVGTAVYTHSIKRTGEKMRAVVPASGRWLPAAAERPAAVVADAPVHPTRHALTRVAVGAVVVFVAALAVLTGVELIAGRPVSDLVRGRSGSGTTAFGDTHQSTARPATPTPTVTVTQTVVPKIVVATPTVTSTAPAVTVTPTVTATPTAPATSSTPAPSGTPTPTSTPSP